MLTEREKGEDGDDERGPDGALADDEDAVRVEQLAHARHDTCEARERRISTQSFRTDMRLWNIPVMSGSTPNDQGQSASSIGWAKSVTVQR